MALVLKKFRIENEYIRKGIAEFLGTFTLIALGCGVNAQYTLGQGQYGGWHSIAAGWGLSVMMGVHVCGNVSGGHINPAVSMAMMLLGKLTWKMFIVYALMQYLASIVASACVYAVYHDALMAFTNGTKSVTGEVATAGIWSTYPAGYLDGPSAFGDLTFSAFVLMVGVMAITDKKNFSPPDGMVPFCVGMLVFVIGLSYGLNCGFALNPARDFGPRLFTYMAGYTTEVFTVPEDYDYWWIPIVACHVGAIAGAFTYVLLIGNHIPDEVKVIELNSTVTADVKMINSSYVNEATVDLSEKF